VKESRKAKESKAVQRAAVRGGADIWGLADLSTATAQK
jgi:hypothetical protein